MEMACKNEMADTAEQKDYVEKLLFHIKSGASIAVMSVALPAAKELAYELHLNKEFEEAFESGFEKFCGVA